MVCALMKRLAVIVFAMFAGCTSGSASDAPKPGKDAKTETKSEAKAKPDAKAKPKADAAPEATPVDPKLLDPAAAKEEAPATYKVKFETTKGDFVVEVTRAWAPNGADRFYNLVKLGFYNDVAFFRAISGFMVQFGLHGSPEVNRAWKMARIPDDAVKQSNKKHYITFATSGKDSRTTQVFINFGNNVNLDGMGFSPFGKVIEGTEIVDKIHTGYGEGAPRGRGPSQGAIQSKGNVYLRKDFPELDYLKKASLVEG